MRYFFDVENGSGHEDQDGDGIELSSIDAARREGCRFASALLADHKEDIWLSHHRTVRVTDENNLTLFGITVVATNASAIS